MLLPLLLLFQATPAPAARGTAPATPAAAAPAAPAAPAGSGAPGSPGAPGAQASSRRRMPPGTDSAATRRPTGFCPRPDSVETADAILPMRPPLVPTPKVVRGLYVNRWAAVGARMAELIRLAQTTEINTLVIDVKDDRGFVLYNSRVPLAHTIGADTSAVLRRDRLRAILDTMRAHAIYPVARIVVAKDPLLARRKLEWSIRQRADTAKPWLDKRGNPWLDPHQDGVWEYAAALACEAIDLGFSEVQFDYVRFPDDARLVREAAFPLARGRLRADVIREQLLATRERLHGTGAPVTADVFGLTVTDTTDMGIGQRWERFVDAVDVVLPMMYPSHYHPGSYGLKNPNANPFETIDRGLKDAHRRSARISGAATLRPWYQDFTLGPPHYTATEVRAQMRAGYANGVDGWILWNPRSAYTVDALRPRGQPERSDGERR